MEALVDKGLVKNIGVSNFNVQLLWDMMSYAKIKPVVNEVELHPYNTQDNLLKFLRQEEIVPIAYCPLGMGEKLNLLCHDLIVSLAQKYSCSPAQIMLSWGIARKSVVIPRSTNLGRISENF